MRRGAISFRCSRIDSPSTPKSIRLVAFDTPIFSAKRRKPSAVAAAPGAR
jgi:hypothetical protein